MKKSLSIILLSLFLFQCGNIREEGKKTEHEGDLEQLIEEYYAVMSERDWKSYVGFFFRGSNLNHSMAIRR